LLVEPVHLSDLTGAAFYVYFVNRQNDGNPPHFWDEVEQRWFWFLSTLNLYCFSALALSDISIVHRFLSLFVWNFSLLYGDSLVSRRTMASLLVPVDNSDNTLPSYHRCRRKLQRGCAEKQGRSSFSSLEQFGSRSAQSHSHYGPPYAEILMAPIRFLATFYQARLFLVCLQTSNFLRTPRLYTGAENEKDHLDIQTSATRRLGPLLME
jgi:hypothetical protein